MTADPSRPTIVALHGLGLSGRLFGPIADRLADTADLLPVDLAGFGASASATGFGADAMVEAVIRAVRRSGATRWMLLGHSMGGKVASLIARRTLDGAAPLFGLAGVVLLAGSPPVPEPMEEDRRDEMVDAVSDGPLDDAGARAFLDANTASPLSAELERIALEDLRTGAPAAWIAWLERGSREDRSAEVGVLDLPALLIAGAEDGDLAAPAQRALNGPVYPRAPVEVVEGAAHLLPFEQPDAVADLVRRFWVEDAGRAPVVAPAFARGLASSRTSARARGAAARRALADPPAAEAAGTGGALLDATALGILRSLAEVLVPQEGTPVDLAIRVDAQLATGVGNGWRNPRLPPDGEAYRRFLPQLADVADLPTDARRSELERLVAGETNLADGTPGEVVALWFEDVIDDLARQWLAHPATQASLGYDGTMNGGDRGRQQGFVLVGLDEHEAWEPAAEGAAR